MNAVKGNDMIPVKKIDAFSAYHNYRYGDYISREILAGSRECGFFLSAEQVLFPDKTPDISGLIYDCNGCQIAEITHSTVTIVNKDCRLDGECGNVCILNKKGEILFGWNTVQYRNTLITQLEGILYNEKGELVRLQ